MSTDFGLINVYKTSGPTSHDIVARVRRGTGIKKVGHAGTLDPLAVGILVLCLGPATRLCGYVMHSRKTYRARVQLGVTTETYDAEGDVTAENHRPVAREDVLAALEQFRGDILQVPPMYSAIKQDGRKLYELAREGEEVERPPRPVTIHRLELRVWEPPFFTLEVGCSSGTYIRSLAHDIGQALGVGAHLAALERTGTGQFTTQNAVMWEDLEAAMLAGTWHDYLLPADLALPDAPAVHLDAEKTAFVRNGRLIPANGATTGDIARAYDPAGQFFAVLARHEDHWKPDKVFNV